MSKILITGAAGFVGSHLVKYLLLDGIKSSDLRLVVAPWDSLDRLPKGKFDIAVADIRNYESLSVLFTDVDIVYHLASKTGYDGGDYQFFSDTIVDGSLHLLKLAKKHGVRKFIFFSSSGVYGLPASGGDMVNIDEFSTPAPTEGYGMAKLEAEKLVKQYCTGKLKYLIVRPVTIFGYGDRAGLYQLIQIIKTGFFFFIGSGKNKVSYVYVKDLIKITRTLEKQDKLNTSLLISPLNPISFDQLVFLLSDILGVSRPKFHLNRTLALILSFITKYIFILIHKKPIFFPNRVKVLTADFYFQVKQLRILLPHYSFYSFKEALTETLTDQP